MPGQLFLFPAQGQRGKPGELSCVASLEAKLRGKEPKPLLGVSVVFVLQAEPFLHGIWESGGISAGLRSSTLQEGCYTSLETCTALAGPSCLLQLVLILWTPTQNLTGLTRRLVQY